MEKYGHGGTEVFGYTPIRVPICHLKVHLNRPGFEVLASIESPLLTFPRQEKLCEPTLMLRYNCVACLVIMFDSKVTAVQYIT